MGCRVRKECLNHALDTNETEGIRGGLNPTERGLVKIQASEKPDKDQDIP